MASRFILLYEEVYLVSRAFGKIKNDGVFQKNGESFFFNKSLEMFYHHLTKGASR